MRSPDSGRPDRSAPETAVSVAPAPGREPAPAPDPVPGREPLSALDHVTAPGPVSGREPAPAPDPVPDRKPAPGREPVRPEQSREDTDAGWGEYPERPDDRLYRDRPPHWDDF